jgi:O-antigen/teichoic acid export membrane protein
MSTAEYGIIAVVQTIGVFVAAVTGLGLEHGAARLVHDEQRGSGEQLAVAKTIIAFQFPILAVVLVVSFATIRLLEEPLDGLLGFNAMPYLDLAMLGAFLAAAASTLTRTSQTFELPWPVFWSRSLEALSRGVLILLLVVSWGMQGTGMLIARAASAGCAVLLIIPGVRRVATGTVRPGVVRAALRFSLPLLPYQLTALVLDGADRIILNEFHGEASVAPYALAYAIGGGAMLLVVNSLVHAEAPTFYQAVRDQNHAFAGRRVIRRIQILALVAVGMNLVGGPAIRLVYDARYASSAALLPLIVSGLFFWGVFSLKNLTLLAQKRSGVSSGVTVATALMNLGLNFVMIPTWGAAGAAVATVIAYALQAVAGVVAERSLAPVPQYLGRLVFLSVGVLISSVLTYGILRN